MYIMLVGTPPFNGEEDDDILNAVKIGHYDTTLPQYQRLSPSAKDLMSKLLKYQPKDRITAEDALKHPWFDTEDIKRINVTLKNKKMYNLYFCIKNGFMKF